MNITENRLKYWASLKGKKHTTEHKSKIGNSVSKLWKQSRTGKTYKEIFGVEQAAVMKEKMRQAKLGRKMPWNSVPERVGAKHPRWIKDRSQVKNRRKNSLDAPQYTEWRRKVFLRDSYKCRIADNTCSNYLEAHHILSWKLHPKLRFNVKNGITLCRVHHPRSRAKEKRLMPLFQKLVLMSVSK